MRTTFLPLLILLFFYSCNTSDKEKLKKEIFNTEKSFEAMAADEGIAEAFTFFADTNAVILRGNDSIIKGREGIRNFYFHKELRNARVTWTPDFIDVSQLGDLGYTYGKYSWKIINEKGDTVSQTGIFHTVWKKQPNGSWRYVWD